MVLPVIKYGHPVLRQKGSRIDRITPEILALISDMIETMRDARGVGLAAQQVGRPLQLTVLDVRNIEDRPSTMQIGGGTVDPAGFMPMTLINPEIKPVGGQKLGPEGCLSFPEIYSEVSRAESVQVRALDQEWRLVEFQAGGLLGRAIQHEVDHLNGVLFIDRMSREKKDELREELEELQAATKAQLKRQRKSG